MKRAGGIAGVFLLVVGAFGAGLALTSAGERASSFAAGDPRDRPTRLEEEVRFELANGYYRVVPRRVLAEPTIHGMLEELGDPYTDYLTPQEYESLRNRTARSYSGVGLTVGAAREGLLVTSALGGPARQAGIRRGDVIVAVDGQPVKKLRFERSLALIKGEEGTRVRLTVKRPRAGKIRFTVVRQEIAVASLRARMLPFRGRKLGYIRLISFRASSAERLERRTHALLRRGARGIVLDLRDNPGGLLSQAVQTVSIFLNEGVVCSTEGVHHERRVYEVSGSATYPRLPLVVLVDRGSASAAEIVAAALGENGRAVVVGQRTYGKASVQSLEELSNGAALKLTTAVYLTPEGRNLGGDGFVPDVKAADDPLTRRDEALLAAQRTLLKQLR